MKKLFLGILILVLAVGCGRKTAELGCNSKLVCSSYSDDGSDHYTNIFYDGDQVARIEMVDFIIVEFPEQVDEMVEETSAAFTAFSKVKGLDVKVDINEAKDLIRVDFTMDFSKLDYTALAKAAKQGFLADLKTYKQSLIKIKAALEDLGFTCE